MKGLGLLAIVLTWTASAMAQPYAYVPGTDNVLRRINIATGALGSPGSVTIGSSYPAFYNVAIPPDATKVYVVDYLEQKLSRVDATTLAVASVTLPTYCATITVTADHTALYLGCSDGTVRKYSPSTLTQITSTTLPGGPFVSTLSVVPASGAYRGRIYATNTGGTIYVLYLDNLAFKKTLQITPCITEAPVLWNGPTGYVLCKPTGSSDHGTIYKINACSGDVIDNSGCYPKIITDSDFRAVAMTLNPGRTAFFVAGEDTDTPGVSTVKRIKVSDCTTTDSLTISGASVYGISNGDTNPASDGGVRVLVAQSNQVTGIKAIASNGTLALAYTTPTSGSDNTVLNDFIPQPAPAVPCSSCSN